MKDLVILLQKRFDEMCATGKLFTSSLSGEDIWNLYLEGFETKEIFRDPESSVHNCNNCKNFVRRYGNIVALDENLNIMSIWDIIPSEEYLNSCKLISQEIKSHSISKIFVETFDSLNNLPYEKCTKHQAKFSLGIAKNCKIYTKEEAAKFGVVTSDKVYTFNHLHLSIPTKFISKENHSIESLQGDACGKHDVLLRGLKELQVSTLELVLELIQQNSILNGLSYKDSITSFKNLLLDYKKYNNDLFAWKNWDNPNAKFKNTLIGVLCSEISSEIGLEKACENWNKRVDPLNYKKATAPISRKQIEEAKKFIQENGYEESFNRRCATLEDIKAEQILHLNVGNGNIKNLSIFDSISPSKVTAFKVSDKIKEISIKDFMDNYLPKCSSIQALLQNCHKNNLVTLTTSKDVNSKKIFAWNNNFSWTYNGNLAGKSFIKEAVKNVGGFVDAPFRFSITWNEDGRSIVDLDAHAITPKGQEISFSSRGRKTSCGGDLDIDMINPHCLGVENIFWKDLSKLCDGCYKFFIRNFNGRNNNGAKAEIEIDGNIFNYHFEGNLQNDLAIAEVYIKNGKFENIYHKLPVTSEVTSTMYELDTNQFHKVNLVCKSPNHWDNTFGNLHYFFMLENCKAPSDIRSFHIENLKSELLQHRKVMEVLGNTTKINSTDNQLSGLGFNATVSEELTVKLEGEINGMYKIKF